MNLAWLQRIWRQLRETGRLIVGVPDYGGYVRHLAEHHPAEVPMSYADFFANRMAARYAKGRSRCC